MAERSHVSQCVSSSDVFCRHNRAGAFTIHFWILFLFISNFPSAYSCAGFLLLPQPPPSPHRQCKAQSRAGRAHSNQWPLPTVLPASPTTIPARAPASSQFKHEQTARLNLPTLFLGNGFLHKPVPRTLLSVQCGSQAEPTLGYWRSRAFCALWLMFSLCNTFAEEVPLLRWPGPLPIVCPAILPLRSRLASSLKN